MIWAGGLGAITSIFGGIAGAHQGRKDQAIASKRLKQGMGYFDRGRQALEDRLALAGPLIGQIIDQAYGAFDAQNALLTDIGDAGYQAIQDAHGVGAGRLNQSFLNRGYFGGSNHGGAFRGLASDVARSSNDLTSQLAGIRSQGLRQSLSQLLGALGTGVQFQVGAGQALQQSFGQQANALLGVGHQPAQGIGAGWGAAGAYFGQAIDDWLGAGPVTAPGAGGFVNPESPTPSVPNPLALNF